MNYISDISGKKKNQEKNMRKEICFISLFLIIFSYLITSKLHCKLFKKQSRFELSI